MKIFVVLIKYIFIFKIFNFIHYLFLLHVNNGKKTLILQNKFQTSFFFFCFVKVFFIDSTKHVFLFL